MPEPKFEPVISPEQTEATAAVGKQAEALEQVAQTPLQESIAWIIEVGSREVLKDE